jgi:phage tail-like protein
MIKTAHAVLRDRGHWRASMQGLAVLPGGDLSLARVPAPANGRAIDRAVSYPYERIASGLALGPCGAVFVSDTAHDRVLFIDGVCGDRAWLPAQPGATLDAPGHFDAPRGLAASRGYLVVADSGHAALQRLAFPRLEANLSWAVPGAPTCMALDTNENLVVSVITPGRLHRIRPDGSIDAPFAARLQQTSDLKSPFGVALLSAGHIVVSDTHADAVFVFDTNGVLVQRLQGAPGWLPGAVAASGDRIFVADAATGAILVFDAGDLVGAVDGWRAPVTALAINEHGDLFIKPGLDERYFVFAADGASVRSGHLLAGPFDAGEGRRWERAWTDADLPPGTDAMVEVALRADAGAPAPADWSALPSADALLSHGPADPARFAWLRLTLRSSSGAAVPLVRQLRLASAAEDYLDYLPATYRRHDTAGFLSRWLKLLRSEFSRVEEALDDLARLADPAFVPPPAIRWLAQWIAFELPQVASDEEARKLLAQAVSLFARRGTPASIARFVELHTGIRPAIVETFAERRVWVLGQSSRLGFDTRLPALDPSGIVVPETAEGMTAAMTADACCQGPIGSAVVGASGPLLQSQIGLPLFADEAWRFCVVVDSYRVRDAAVLDELRRIVEREKPAHTDFRVMLVSPDMRVGYQARIGIDAIVGGEPPAGALGTATLDVDARLPRADAPRVGDVRLDGALALQ